MSVTHHDTEEFRGARFTHADLSGVRFRDCDLTGLRIIDCIIGDGVISGDFDRLVVNDVDVTDFVRNELDRREPERMLVRSLNTAQDHRDTWAAIERMWAGTHEHLAGLPAPVVAARVDEEWSAVETLRHLIFATDAWAARAILARARPYHPAGLPAGGYPTTLPPRSASTAPWRRRWPRCSRCGPSGCRSWPASSPASPRTSSREGASSRPHRGTPNRPARSPGAYV